jgi:hypothetical protein
MFYGNTKSLLESIVRKLQSEPPENDAEWQAQTELVQGCLSEMMDLSEPPVNSSMGTCGPQIFRIAPNQALGAFALNMLSRRLSRARNVS